MGKIMRDSQGHGRMQFKLICRLKTIGTNMERNRTMDLGGGKPVCYSLSLHPHYNRSEFTITISFMFVPLQGVFLVWH